jgi:DNA primase catalytic core
MVKNELKDEIDNIINLVDVIKQSGVKLTSDGSGKYTGGHENKHDSESGKCLVVEGKVWNCFHCHEGGDVYSWIANANNLNIKRDFPKILHIAADICGIKIKEKKKINKNESEASVFDCIDDSVDYYHSNITEKLYKYIHKQWGINKESVDKYRIGYSRPGLYKHLIKLGYNKNQILKTGLFAKLGKDEMIEVLEKRIIFPYLDNNNPIYMIGRNTFNDNRPKYVKLPVNNKRKNYISKQIKNVIFGIDSLTDADPRFCLITEGVTDCIMAHQYGIPTISPVTVQFRKKDSEIVYEWIKDFETIYICNDNEVNQAGLEGAKAIAWSLIEKGVDVKLVTLPKDDDVNKIDVAEYLRDHTKEEFLSVLKSGKNPTRDYVPAPEDFLTEQGGFKHREFAEWLMKHSKYRFVNFRDNPKDVYYYNNGIYVPYGIATAQTIIEHIMDGYVNNNNVKEVIGHIMRGSVIDREDIRKDIFIINVLNGLVEIKNGGIEFRDHSPEYITFNQLNVEFHDDATSPVWDKFINSIQPNSEESYKTIKMLAYSLLPDWSQQKWFILLGKEGGNGKSVLLRVIRDLLGEKNCSAVPIQDLQSTFKGARLYMKLANIASDVQERKMKHFDIVKSLTGGDPIEIEMKYKDSFDYINVATLMFSMNDIPKLDEILDGATRRRMIILEFNQIFRGESADKNMLKKLTTPEEKSGLFLQLCNMLVDYYNDSYGEKHITLFDDITDDDAFQIYNKNRYTKTHTWVKTHIHVTGKHDDRIAICDIRDEILLHVDEIEKLGKKEQLQVVRNLLNFTDVIHDPKLTTKNKRGKQNIAIGGIEWRV